MTILIIVESPTKAKTLTALLPREYRVMASVGHIRDLPTHELGVDPAANFRPTYVVHPDKTTIVARLQRAAQSAQTLILATDPDREGEAIAWHLIQVLHDVLPAQVQRCTFHEITAAAVTAALAAPGQLNQPLVRAAEVRRIIDRLVGYGVSPVLSHALQQPRLSAGRVQTAAVRLVVEREHAIAAFVSTTTYAITGTFQPTTPPQPQFTAHLHDAAGQKLMYATTTEANTVINHLRAASYHVVDVQCTTQTRAAPPPFTTSTLQQAASKLGFAPTTTMKIAQELFEGITLPNTATPTGLITYMRTDSVHVAPEAQQATLTLIRTHFGEEYAPEKPNSHRTRTAAAQEAHEAIRPTEPTHTPTLVETALSPAQHTLYQLIWTRFIASQMAPARTAVTTVQIAPATLPYTFHARGAVPQFAGWRQVYQDNLAEEAEPEPPLPELAPRQPLTLTELTPTTHQTKAPARFTEATLIKELEKRGIGRPSTFASVIANIERRDYIEPKGKKRELHPTELGRRVLTTALEISPEVFDLHFTATVEAELDRIARGEVPPLTILQGFWEIFHPRLQAAQTTAGYVPRADRPPPQPTTHTCPACGQDILVRRAGPTGEFLSCARYPQCKYTQPPDQPVPATLPPCPQCKGKLIPRTGANGPFLACSRYPKCKYTEEIEHEPA